MFQYNTIEEALEDLRQGKMILCTDDPDRENEGRPHLRCRVCHHGKRELHGHPRQGAHLHAHVL